MIRRFWVFLGTLCLLLGLEILATQSIVLTSECTKMIAKQNPKIERKRWWVEALTGDDLEYPEKEVKVHPTAGYVLLFVASVGFMHSFFILTDKK